MIGPAIAGATFLGFWLLFVFQVSISELIAGLLASTLALFAARATFRTVPLCFEPKARWIAQVWRLPGMIGTDLWLLAKHLVRHFGGQPSRSSFETLPLRPYEGDCRASSQRALATLLVSLTPNSVVLSIDSQVGDLLLHRLEPAPVPEIMKSLEE